MLRTLQVFGLLAVAFGVFLLFFRYDYVHSVDGVFRVDRLTGSTCTMPCLPPMGAWAEMSTVAPVRGSDVYAQNCASCHGASGSGGGIGPTLRHEHERMSVTQIDAFIRNPRPPMPRLYPSTLDDEELAAVAEYVGTL
jgi:mono/diheme cytochrome c family protein